MTIVRFIEWNVTLLTPTRLRDDLIFDGTHCRLTSVHNSVNFRSFGVFLAVDGNDAPCEGRGVHFR